MNSSPCQAGRCLPKLRPLPERVNLFLCSRVTPPPLSQAPTNAYTSTHSDTPPEEARLGGRDPRYNSFSLASRSGGVGGEGEDKKDTVPGNGLFLTTREVPSRHFHRRAQSASINSVSSILPRHKEGNEANTTTIILGDKSFISGYAFKH